MAFRIELHCDAGASSECRRSDGPSMIVEGGRWKLTLQAASLEAEAVQRGWRQVGYRWCCDRCLPLVPPPR
jgi:hypothetical protein